MKISVLVATMNQNNSSILKKMNINSDAIIANQCDRNNIEMENYNDNRILILNFNERGVGLNRNNALMRSKADICILADDDMCFLDNYTDIVNEAYSKNPKADVILFNIQGSERNNTKRKKKINKYNYMRYGASRITFKRKKISYEGIFFNQNFGGGTIHNCGEDTLFLHDCIKKKLNIIHVPVTIASIDNKRVSTWFKGYDEKFFYDRGILHSIIYNKNYIKFLLINIIYIIKNRDILSKKIGFFKALSVINKGSIDYCKDELKYE